MIEIVLKKIVNGSYGENIPFSIGQILDAPTEYTGGTAPYRACKWEPSAMEAGTDLNVILNEGDIVQAFDLEDNPLGFKIKRFNNSDGQVRYIFYNEEVECFEYGQENSECSVGLFVNQIYKSNTLEGALSKAEYMYYNDFDNFKNGMDNTEYGVLEFVFFHPSYNYWYSGSGRNALRATSHTKLRPFSSWYKIITGKWYKEEELLSFAVYDSDKKFYIGKLFNPIPAVTSLYESDMSAQIENDPGYIYKDVIYGTGLGYFLKTWGETILTPDGTKIGMERASSAWIIYPYFSKLVDGSTYKINFRLWNYSGFNGPQGQGGLDTGASGIFFSKLNACLKSDGLNSGEYGDSNQTGVDLFLSPDYNDWTAEEFKEKLETVSHTAEEWKKMFGRVLTFCLTDFISKTSEWTVENAYGGNFERTTATFNGYEKLTNDSYYLSTYYPDDSDLVNTFNSVEAWKTVINFVTPEPEPGPDPEPEPTPVKKRTSKLNIKELSQMAIKNGTPLLGDVEKLQPFAFMSEYLEDFEMFDEDLGETRGFYWPIWNIDSGTEEEVLEHFRKRSAFTIKKHLKELDSLWKIANTTFDPAYNVEEHLIEEITKSGTDTLKDAFDEITQTDQLGARKNISKFGEQSQTQNVGSQTSSVEYGEQGTTNVTGAQTGSNTTGEYTSTTTNEHAGFNSSSYQKNDKSMTDNSSQTSSSSVGERTDSSTTESYTDTTISGARSDQAIISAHTDEVASDAVQDTHQTTAREDVHEQSYNNTVSRKYDRQGNVGTMSTPELLQKATDSTGVFDFYNKLYDLILKELAIYYEE